MKFFNAPMPAPNPRRVRIFLAEKGVELPTVEVGIMTGELKQPEHLARDPLGQLPTLQLDDGSFLSETVAICRYLESLYPTPPMFGRTALETARIDMLTRRVEFQIGTPAGMFWRHAHPFTARVVVPQYKEFGESNRAHYERGTSDAAGATTHYTDALATFATVIPLAGSIYVDNAIYFSGRSSYLLGQQQAAVTFFDLLQSTQQTSPYIDNSLRWEVTADIDLNDCPAARSAFALLSAIGGSPEIAPARTYMTSNGCTP